MLGTRTKGRRTTLSELLAAIFVPATLVCVVLLDAHPHRLLWHTLGLVFAVLGVPAACLNVVVRWHSRRRS